MNRHTVFRYAAGALLAGNLGAGLAADITMIEPASATVALSAGQVVVRFAVSGTAGPRDHCGYFVDYGDGAAGDSRVIDRENGRFSRPHERTFTRPGTYTVRASGRQVKTTGACNGSATAMITVVAQGPSKAERRAERRAHLFPCPEGWALNEKSVNRATGAYHCVAKPVQLDCAEGLRYYERDGIIGCRPGRGNR